MRETEHFSQEKGILDSNEGKSNLQDEKKVVTLKEVLDALKAGTTLEEVARKLNQRVNVIETKLFNAAIVQDENGKWSYIGGNETELKENQANESLKSNASEGTDYLKAQSLRKEYVTWLNLKIEEFFVQCELDKKGTELPVRHDFKLDNAIDNIGWLTKNIHQSIYQVLKKKIGEFTTKDYGIAKGIVVEKLEFYLKEIL